PDGARRAEEREEPDAGQATTEAPADESELPATTEIPVAPGEGAHVALVIDDLGWSLDDLAALEALAVPISYAVLPFAEETPAVVAALAEQGKEVLCHLPMEAVDGQDPGPGALRLGMPPEELERSTEAAIAAVPGAVGVNNHMGSGLSADPRSMESILAVLARRGLFYLDSRTSPRSVGYRVARTLGVPAAERQVFLDTDPAPDAVRRQFARLLGLARERGAAIAIGHPHPATLATLAREVPRAQELGYRFVPVSYLLDQTGEPPE
ncbi:MAG: divergent polysaccharide deacetylase family protein, partial [Thermoanaerobaculia bacterium]